MVNGLRSVSVVSVFIGDLHSQPSSQTVLPCAFFLTSLAALCAFIVACEGTGHTFKLTSLLGAEGTERRLPLSSILYPDLSCSILLYPVLFFLSPVCLHLQAF
ncbi:hypothetical protein MHYP_G00064640 [Metynnis hypsauchen]